MGVFEWAFGKRGRMSRRIPAIDPIEAIVGYRRNWRFTPIPFDDRPIEERYVSWDYICANRNATALSSLPLRAYARKRSKSSKCFESRPVSRKSVKVAPKETTDDLVELTDHPALTVLARPNPINSSLEDLIFLTAVYLQMKATAYWYLRPNVLGQPMEIWPLPAQYMYPVYTSPGSKDVIDYFELRFAGRQSRFSPDQIVWFRIPSPVDPLSVWGDSDGIKSASEVNRRMTEHEHAIFENFAVPDNLVIPEEPQPPSKMEEIAASWAQKFGGWRKRGRTEFATFPIKDVLKLGMTMQELEFKDTKPQVREEIAAGRGVPLPIITVDGSTFSNMKHGLQLWADFTVDPLGCRIASAINNGMMSKYGVDRNGRPEVFLSFDSAVPDDETEYAERAVKLVQADILTRDEVRGDLGRDPHPDGRGAEPFTGSELQIHRIHDLSNMEDREGEPDFDSVQSVIDAEPGEDAQAEAGESRVEQVDITFNEISLAMERAFKINDLETVNMLRAELAKMLGVKEPKPLSELAAKPIPEVGDEDEDTSNSDGDATPPDDSGADSDATERSGKATDGTATKDVHSTAEGETSGAMTGDPGEAPSACVRRHLSRLKGEGIQHETALAQAIAECEREGKCWNPSTKLEAAVCGVFPEIAHKSNSNGNPELADSSREFANKLDAFWVRMEESVLSVLSANEPQKGLKPGDILGETLRWVEELIGLSRPFIADAYDIGARVGREDLSESDSDTLRVAAQAATVSPKASQRAVKEICRQFSSSVVDVTKSELSEILTSELGRGDGDGDGTDYRQISKRISALFRAKRSHATDRIARTELVNTLNRGSADLWREAGVKRHRWLASVDACEFCLALDGKVRKLGGAFLTKGGTLRGVDGGSYRQNYKAVEGPTLHPICRCTTVPEID